MSFQIDDSEPGSINEVPSTPAPGPSIPAPGQKRPRSGSAVSTPPADTTSAKQIAEQAIQLMTRSDEHSAFGDHIASELRRLPSEEAHRLKRRLTRTLLDFWDEQEVS